MGHGDRDRVGGLAGPAGDEAIGHEIPFASRARRLSVAHAAPEPVSSGTDRTPHGGDLRQRPEFMTERFHPLHQRPRASLCTTSSRSRRRMSRQ